MFKPIRTVSTLVVLLALFAVTLRGDEKPEFSGWWVRVHTDHVKSITFHVGTSAKDRDYWFTWRKGEGTDFELPKEFRDSPRVYLHAMVNPSDSNTELCVYFKHRPAKRFKFDDAEGHAIKVGDDDDDCR